MSRVIFRTYVRVKNLRIEPRAVVAFVIVKHREADLGVLSILAELSRDNVPRHIVSVGANIGVPLQNVCHAPLVVISISEAAHDRIMGSDLLVTDAAKALKNADNLVIVHMGHLVAWIFLKVVVTKVVLHDFHVSFAHVRLTIAVIVLGPSVFDQTPLEFWRWWRWCERIIIHTSPKDIHHVLSRSVRIEPQD